ncbi:ubiquitin carboxyl-terminal hydrolase 9Y-like isoform X2 [Dysidea avara]|uniref:ubiquitin carboxyl-terminal hydrolase 9Y-like isoform X2 n=1 Tax=Dysidea avara TaxID=196820 RepID=UPI0033349AB9
MCCKERSQLAVQIVYEDARLKKAWKYALLWLNGELERKPYASTTYSYANWSPPAQSNEVSNGSQEAQMKTVMSLLFLEVIQMLGCRPQKQKFMALTAPEAQNTKYHKTPVSQRAWIT